MSDPLRIAITGAGGFIGGALLRALASREARGVQARALVRTRGRLPVHSWLSEVEGDLLGEVPAELFAHEPQVLVHLATKGIDTDGTGYQAVNVTGSERLLAALPESVRVALYTSSVSVSGQGSKQGESEEALPPAPTTELARSRAAAEQVWIQGMAARGASAICTRARYVLGVGDRHTLPGLLRLTQSGWGVASGEQRFSVIDVDDYAQLLLDLAERQLAASEPFQGPLHVGYRRGLSLNEIQSALAEAWSLAPPSRRVRLPKALTWGLSALPSKKTQRWATVYQLFGSDHWIGVDRLASWLGEERVARDPREVLAEAIAWLLDVAP